MRNAALHLQEYARPPREVRGTPSAIRIGEIVGVNSAYGDARPTVDVRPQLSRATKVGAPYPLWYSPRVGDWVLYCDLHGDPNTPIVLVPLDGGVLDELAGKQWRVTTEPPGA